VRLLLIITGATIEIWPDWTRVGTAQWSTIPPGNPLLALDERNRLLRWTFTR
jgi:hypothetical protein